MLYDLVSEYALITLLYITVDFLKKEQSTRETLSKDAGQRKTTMMQQASSSISQEKYHGTSKYLILTGETTKYCR